MPRSRKGLTDAPTQPEPETPPDDEEAWGSPPEAFDSTGQHAAGEPPPMPGPGSGMTSESPSEPPESVAALGAPPDDTVGGAKWAYQLHMRLAHHAMMDKTLTPTQRRKEVRIILGGAAKHMTDALRYDALEAIAQDREELERKKRGKASAKMVSRPAVGSAAKVIPIRRDG